MAGKRTAIVVPGHGDVDLDGAHRITRRCLRLVEEAERLVGNGGAEAVVFSGWSSTGGPTEAEQMRDAWRGPEVELVVEPTARNTAENASRTLPLLLERGVERAVVVCSLPHLPRVRFFFRRLYAGRGLATEFRAVRTVPRLSAIAWELAALPLTPWQLYVQALISCNEFVYVN